ncbi:putative secondary metabolism biosynthetic enzyme [Gnomoniopsis sp. IMI 355080]|nr:putative secondary metabolism biosynthetic enzyme [Gnomoniopsis sp. IMI 355080]
MKAIIIRGRGDAAITVAKIPEIRDREGYILVKTSAVAVNPSDWKHIDFMWVGDPTGTRPGLDYAGTVVEVGVGVEPKDRLKPGDRVFGICNGSYVIIHPLGKTNNSADRIGAATSNVREPEDGTFAEYLVAKACFAIKIPDIMQDTEACTIGSVAAQAQGLYQSLQLPLPDVEPLTTRKIPILIYGASTASGVMGIQWAKMSNCTVVVTCSPKNFAYLKELGADFCVDYHAEDCAAQIQAFTKGRLKHAWDCISTVESARICAAAMSALGGHYCSLLFLTSSVLKKVNPRITCSTVLGYTILGEDIEKETVVKKRPEDFEHGKMFWKTAENLLLSGRFRPVQQVVNQGGRGLDGILKGLQYLKQGKVSAQKLVYTIG